MRSTPPNFRHIGKKLFDKKNLQSYPYIYNCFKKYAIKAFFCNLVIDITKITKNKRQHLYCQKQTAVFYVARFYVLNLMLQPIHTTWTHL